LSVQEGEDVIVAIGEMKVCIPEDDLNDEVDLGEETLGVHEDEITSESTDDGF
jgi:hypothetical protein